MLLTATGKENVVYRQAPPYAVQLEMSQGCNLGCDFCGIHAIGYQKMKRGSDQMTVEMAANLAMQMKEAHWCPRIEFAMHGEPTLNKNRVPIIRVFRTTLPRAYIMMTSNGGGLLGGDVTENIDDMFKAGLNTLALDNYESVNIVPKLREKYKGKIEVVDYPGDPRGNPHLRHTGQIISVVKDISVATAGTHSHLNNHAGSAFPLNDKGKGKRCAKPFREMSIRWDGNVALCCNDWPGYYRCGNVVKDGLDAVWNGPAFAAARRMLYRGRREMTPCKGCDALSYRPGLLPDHLGKKTLAYPDAEDKKIIAAALKKGPYTTPVRKPLIGVKVV